MPPFAKKVEFFNIANSNETQYLKAGRCKPTATLPSVIADGTGRITMDINQYRPSTRGYTISLHGSIDECIFIGGTTFGEISNLKITEWY